MPNIDDEKSLFQKAMKDVKPLNKKFEKRLKHKKMTPAKVNHDMSAYNGTLDRASEGNFDILPILPEDVLSYKTHAISFNQFNKLRSGKVTYRNTIDLHKLTCEKAIESIRRFINNNYNNDINSCLIIHGKGQGLVKAITEKTLLSCPKVLAFHSAIPRHGGTGAVYVLLKSQR